MAYNIHGPSSTLSSAERSAEALRLLDLLRSEDQEELDRRLSTRALEFLDRLWSAQSLLTRGQELSVSEPQLLWLRDLWGKFA